MYIEKSQNLPILKKMKAILLLSGSSSRMAPISDKSFLEFCGESLAERILRNAREGGISEFVLVANPQNQPKIEKMVAENRFLKNAKIAVQKNLAAGMSGGVAAGLEKVAENEPVFVLGGNDWVESAVFSDLVSVAGNSDGAILAQKVSKYFPGGYLQIDDKNRIKSITEKPGAGNEPSDLVNIVVHFFQNSSSLRQKISELDGENADIYEKVLSALFCEKTFLALPYSGTWQAIKYPWHVLEMAEIFQRASPKLEVHPTAEVAKSAVLKGNCKIEAHAQIGENAVVSNSFIGQNAQVGNNTLVRDSIIGQNSVIGFGSEIARSFLAANVSTHLAYLGDSVVDSGANFGAFSATANLRLDGAFVKVSIKNERLDSGRKKFGAIVGSRAQIGVHASLMPGCKVEINESVAPNSVKK